MPETAQKPPAALRYIPIFDPSLSVKRIENKKHLWRISYA